MQVRFRPGSASAPTRGAAKSLLCAFDFRGTPRSAYIAMWRRVGQLSLVSLLFVSLAGCSYFQFPGVHRINIQQGHIITQDMLDQLQPGMTKRQVRFVLGDPLLPDTFNDDRWVYYYSIRRGSSGHLFQRSLNVHFEDGVMTHYDGDYIPSRPGDAPVTGDADADLPTPPGEDDDELVEPQLQEIF